MAIEVIKPRTKVKDPERSRHAILQGALEEFAQYGFDGATVRRIGSRIGLSHGMIRYHYETKEKLWFAAVDFLFERLHRELQVTDEETQRLEAGDMTVFRDWLRRYVHYCARHPEHARIMMQESVSPSDRLQYAAQRYVREQHIHAEAVISALRDRGNFPRNAPTVSIIYMITGACQNIFALASEAKISLGEDTLSEKAISAHADLILAMFCPEN